ncbi:Variant Ionotropic Glutamate Receptor [Penaeus vannamei]|uniref:Variant Ionotropic Glutamate Receptor n=1 Tax=Penaeus vannamei TaxID=6689 RepID=A0A423SSY7_PENVA|nr:Variant Ionotropic Glutamate Receptor [Penaeus vannamei]
MALASRSNSGAGKGQCLKLCIELFGPHINFIIGKPPHYSVVGYMGEIIRIVAKQLDFCYEYVLSRDRVFGSQFPNGSWNGLMRMLTEREVAMSGVVLSVDETRARAVDFSDPLHLEDQVLGYKRPVYEADVLGFVRPYTVMTWILLLLTMLAIFAGVLVLHLSHGKIVSKEAKKSEASEEGVQAESPEDQVVTSVSLAYQWTLSILLAQSLPKTTRDTSLRVIMGLWLIGALIVGSVYRSNLKAMLTLPKLRLPFDSLDDLVKTDIPTYITEGSMLHQALMTHSCPLYIARESFFRSTGLAFAFPKGSPLRDKVNSILKEAGIVDHLLRSSVNKYVICKNAEKLQQQNDRCGPLELEDFYGVLSVYAGGILLSFLVFLAEVTFGKRSK